MPRCALTGKGPVAKNSVSRSNIKTKGRAFPNIQQKRLFSRQLGQFVSLRVCVSAIRDIDKIGELDTFLLRQKESLLSLKALRLKRRILKKMKKPSLKPLSS